MAVEMWKCLLVFIYIHVTLHSCQRGCSHVKRIEPALDMDGENPTFGSPNVRTAKVATLTIRGTNLSVCRSTLSLPYVLREIYTLRR